MQRSIAQKNMLKYFACLMPLAIAACATAPAPRPYYVPSAPHYALPVQGTSPVVTVYEEPPLAQPEPVAIRWAPPPMLVEVPPAAPYPGAIWIGGYWVWQGAWVWAHGHWASPPRPGYYWVHPYYEHRNDEVIFVTGYWSPPQAVFVPPALNIRINLAWVKPGVVPGPQPIGPSGVFVPAPPGSRPGIIIPAPLGTPPAVVTGAPPVINVGMHIQNNTDSHNTIINNVTNIRNVTQVTNVTIVAPPSAVANGKPVNAVIPAQPHLAAAMHPIVNMPAPAWANEKRGTPMAAHDAAPALAPHGNAQASMPPATIHTPANGPVSSWAASASSTQRSQEKSTTPAELSEQDNAESHRHSYAPDAMRENKIEHPSADPQRKADADSRHAPSTNQETRAQHEAHAVQPVKVGNSDQHGHRDVMEQKPKSKESHKGDEHDHDHEHAKKEVKDD